MRAPAAAYSTAVDPSQDKVRLVHLVEIIMPAVTYRYVIGKSAATFAGNDYTPTAGTYTELQEDTGREVPSARLTLWNGDGVLGGLFDAWGLSGKDARRKRVRIITCEEATIGTATALVADTFIIESYPSMSRTQMTFELGAAAAIGTMIPSAEIQGYACRWQWRGHFCGYVGTATPCARTIIACLERDNVARFGAEVGRNVRQVVFS